MKKQISFLIFAILSCLSISWGQFQYVDSLERVLTETNLTKEERIKTLLEVSDLYLSRNPDKSFTYTNEAIDISRSISNNELLGLSYRSLGNCYSFEGDYDSSMYYLEMALKLEPNDQLTWFYYGQNEWYNGDWEDECLPYYKRAEHLCIMHNDLKTLSIVYYSMADFYRYTQRDSLAQHYISLSIRILERSTLYADLATAYNVQAEMYRTKGEYKKGLETYVKIAKIAYQVLDSTRIGYCFSRMGYIYYMQNQFDLAEKFLVRSLDIGEKVQSRNLKLFALKSLTDMFSNLGDEENCLYYARLCINEGVAMREESAISLAYSSLSNLYYRVGKKDSAIYYANRSYEYAKVNDDPINMINAILNKIPIEYENGNYISVVDLTSEGIELASETETMEHLRDLYKYRYRAYEKLNNKAASFEAFDKYKMYDDSLNSNDVELEMQKSQLEMGYQDKHLADTLVYIENAQKAQQEILLRKQQSKFSLAIGIIVAVLLSIIILIVWVTSIKRKKLNLSLVESNHDKELLLKEIHHRVKNSLQVVSSLLNLQKTQADHKSFNELIDESQVKIGNIAIVHELLYQSSSFKKINLHQYIDKLTDHIILTLSDTNKQVKFIKEIENIEISLDKSVPLALVMNEIITNSVKYAFKDMKEGIIHISCSKREDLIEVRIHDNGPGLPVEQLNKSKGIGITLIEGFVKQLKGQLKYGNDNGCFFVFSFPDTNQP